MTLLSQIIILGHNAIPHHHHHSGGEVLCLGVECEAHQNHNHQQDHDLHICDSDTESACTDFFDLFSQHNEDFGSNGLLFNIKKDIFLEELRQVNFIVSFERCISQYFNSSPLLRAPPAVILG